MSSVSEVVSLIISPKIRDKFYAIYSNWISRNRDNISKGM